MRQKQIQELLRRQLRQGVGELEDHYFGDAQSLDQARPLGQRSQMHYLGSGRQHILRMRVKVTHTLSAPRRAARSQNPADQSLVTQVHTVEDPDGHHGFGQVDSCRYGSLLLRQDQPGLPFPLGRSARPRKAPSSE